MNVPRALFIGVFAAFFRKLECQVLLRLADDRGAWVFGVEGISLSDLRAGTARPTTPGRSAGH
jgi:hypothetical protein